MHNSTNYPIINNTFVNLWILIRHKHKTNSLSKLDKPSPLKMMAFIELLLVRAQWKCTRLHERVSFIALHLKGYRWGFFYGDIVILRLQLHQFAKRWFDLSGRTMSKLFLKLGGFLRLEKLVFVKISAYSSRWFLQIKFSCCARIFITLSR